MSFDMIYTNNITEKTLNKQKMNRDDLHEMKMRRYEVLEFIDRNIYYKK